MYLRHCAAQVHPCGMPIEVPIEEHICLHALNEAVEEGGGAYKKQRDSRELVPRAGIHYTSRLRPHTLVA
jgi:hypothetical protein